MGPGDRQACSKFVDGCPYFFVRRPIMHHHRAARLRPAKRERKTTERGQTARRDQSVLCRRPCLSCSPGTTLATELASKLYRASSTARISNAWVTSENAYSTPPTLRPFALVCEFRGAPDDRSRSGFLFTRTRLLLYTKWCKQHLVLSVGRLYANDASDISHTNLNQPTCERFVGFQFLYTADDVE